MKSLKAFALPVYLLVLLFSTKPVAAQQSNVEKYVLALHEKKVRMDVSQTA